MVRAIANGAGNQDIEIVRPSTTCITTLRCEIAHRAGMTAHVAATVNSDRMRT